MTPIAFLDHLSNPLATPDQLIRLQEDVGDNAQSIRFAQCQLTQAAGILLRLPQEVIATAIVTLQRYLINANTLTDQAYDSKTTSAATIYLTAKLSFTPLSPRSVINVYAFLMSPASPLWFINPEGPPTDPDATSYFVTEGTYEREKARLFTCESLILASLGFQTHVALPHTLALTYLQALGASHPNLAHRVLKHLNGGLLSPQVIYLTHQPNALAVAAIYLAARETGTKLVDGNWWEVFDVDREDLGFLVLAFGSLENFARAERQKWEGKRVPLQQT